MYKKRAVLRFGPEVVNKPITCRLIRRFDITINILQARIFPGEEGQLILELQNESEKDLNAGIRYLEQEGVEVEVLEETVVVDEERCINCGGCTGICKTGALRLNPETWELEVDQSQCLLCETCVGACPMKAITLEERVTL